MGERGRKRRMKRERRDDGTKEKRKERGRKKTTRMKSRDKRED